MASEAKKKLEAKSLSTSNRPLVKHFCSDCMYTWCSLRGKIVYCTQKYRGVQGLSLVCQKSAF
ncbi:hypothetical protein DRO91_04630 [Candidatus Heimdallarchaeota archaeon]|nr:MAG: hypothetical protein DRO63_01480 [Candidatus Gerdarchaeota archaeon]RLI72301.1 MAG: hypothetical protein DRO91_04630 [Candidatus Heimdallarchaeota archaeon]